MSKMDKWAYRLSAVAMAWIVVLHLVGCFSSTRKYTTSGEDAPPTVTHTTESWGIGPAPSPVESAKADAIGTDAKTRRAYGGYGYGDYGAISYGGGGVGTGGGQVYQTYPSGVPVNRVIFIRNETRTPLRLAVNGRPAGWLPPDESGYVVGGPHGAKLAWCSYERAGAAGTAGAYLRKGSQGVATRPGRKGFWRIQDWDMRSTAPCAF